MSAPAAAAQIARAATVADETEEGAVVPAEQNTFGRHIHQAGVSNAGADEFAEKLARNSKATAGLHRGRCDRHHFY